MKQTYFIGFICKFKDKRGNSATQYHNLFSQNMENEKRNNVFAAPYEYKWCFFFYLSLNP
jgi:hypothetical protein